MGDGNQAAGVEAAVRKPFAVESVHLLRTAMQVQYQLSQMADQKASMLLGVTFVIFTISVGQWKVGQPQPALLVLAAAAFVAASITITAVLPSVRPRKRPVEAPTGNILFFGAFTQMDEAAFVDHMTDVAFDSHAVVQAFARDIYQNGRVLADKKYRLIGYAYRVMLAGLLVSAIVFAVPLLSGLLG